MEPADLFRIERIGAIEWAPDWRRAAVEMPRPGRWIDRGIPTATLAVVDVAAASLRTVSPSSTEFVGFFGASWSPDGRRLLFLSVDTVGVARPWLWDARANSRTLLPGLKLHDCLGDPPRGLWVDNERIVFLARDSGAPDDGPLYFRINRGRNVADAWRRAREGTLPAVWALESRGPNAAAGSAAPAPPAGTARLVLLDLRTRGMRTLARGAIHRPRLSANRDTLTVVRENPPLPVATVASFFGPEARGDDAYDRVNWGGETTHIDVGVGAPTPPPALVEGTPDSRARPALRASSGPSGTTLILQRPRQADVELWRGNAWLREVIEARAESVSYSATDGRRLTGWLLYPARYAANSRIPIVTVVYPGRVYGDRRPAAFSLFDVDFEHPQLFAALGYGVLLPSMPATGDALAPGALDSLSVGVLPLLDTLVARGTADPSRIAVLGQSAGGYAVLGLIGRTSRFRSAIASASYANLVSLYGTFYGQYRHGDAGHPQRAQVLRMLQFERGFFAANAPPWEAPERYRLNSPLWQLGEVRTPLLLIHGEADFIPVQQAEEVFTALYRQDKRVRLLRYAGEQHTITARANVLHLWRQVEDWLRATMPPD